MKKNNWYRALSAAYDKYIAEAHPDNMIKPQRNKAFLSAVAACACFALIACSLWLFIPFKTTPPDVSQYADSEYYGVIQKLNALTFEQPKYKNNAQKLLAKLKNISFGATKAESATSPEDGAELGATGSYKEITDLQVGGVIEADRIKRSDTHIYYLDGDVLRIYSIEGEDTKEVGSYKLHSESNHFSLGEWEFYLSKDCKTATVVTQYYTKNASNPNRHVSLISLDVSCPEKIVKKDEFTVTGAYMSSRNTNGSILLLSEFVIDKNLLELKC